jgi:hypothetical protein
MAVLRHARDIAKFERAQRAGRWGYIHPRDPASVSVGVMGLGELGGRAAAELARHGFQLHGWSRMPKAIEGVTCSAGEAALDAFLGRCEILVCMLPLTPATTGLMTAERFAALPRGASFVNVARGAVVDEPALVAALPSILRDGPGADHAACGVHRAARVLGRGDRGEYPADPGGRSGAAPDRSGAGVLRDRRRYSPSARAPNAVRVSVSRGMQG